MANDARMPESIQPVILSGGSGSRLWPASREKYPKQLLPLVSGKSTLLQDTVSRLSGLASQAGHCIVVCNEAHRFLVAEQLRELDVPATIVLEPEGRNTAPAVALAAFVAMAANPDAMLLVMPADHVIRDRDAFQAAVSRGLAAAVDGKLVTFGVVPTAPETGYGYIEACPDGDAVVPIAAFVEKPNADTAEAYVRDGEHFWNSGMFLFGARAYLDALKEFEPEMHEACRASGWWGLRAPRYRCVPAEPR
jgi:mannose-1-phosphate guanylyltransferase/mannose-6-phosphate isomerase